MEEQVLSENFLIHGGGRSTEILQDMDVDAEGNTYITGKAAFNFSSDTAWLDPLIGRGIGGDDIITVKYNKYGKAIWAKVFGSTNWDEGEAIAAGGDGHCYVAGVFGGPTFFGATQLTPEVSFNGSGTPNQMDMFLTRLDGQGNVVWVRQIAGVGYEQPTGIDIDASGNIIVTGYFYQKINFGSIALSTQSSSFFIAKYSANGNLLWARSYGNNYYGDMYPDDLAIDVSGNIIIGGSFSGLQDFGGITLQSNGQDNFVAKYDLNGNMIWATKLGGPGSEIGYCVALDNGGNIYFGGLFQSTITQNGFTINSISGSDAFLAKFNTSGQLQWLKSAGGTSEEGVTDLVVQHDTLYSIGYFIENFNIAGQVIADTQDWNGFITRHDLQGNFAGLQVFSLGAGVPKKIQIDPEGNCYMAGYFYNNITIRNMSTISNGYHDLFLWRGKL